MLRPYRTLCLLTALPLCACGGDDVNNAQAVQKIFDDFQPTMEKIIKQGLAAKDASTNGANITPVSANGTNKGTLTIGGKVAQGTSLNENLDLWVQLDGPYSDSGKIFYATDNSSDTTKLQFGLQMSNQPQDNGMSGTLVGPLKVTGDIEGTAAFDLRFATDLTDDDAAPAIICSHVLGTVTQGDQSKSIDFLLPQDTSGLDAPQLDKCKALAP